MDELQAYAATAAGPAHDDYSRQALARALTEYAPRRREAIAPFALTVDGRPYPTLLAALGDPGAEFASVEVSLADAPRDPRSWEWMTPFERLAFDRDGSAEIGPIAQRGSSRRAIARILLREHYIPRPRAELERRSPAPPEAGDGVASPLLTLAEGAKYARERRILPFCVALLLYTAEERYRIELDLIDNAVQRDPRAGRLGLERRVRRSSRLSFALDGQLARGRLPLANARVLEMLAETHGLTALEVGDLLGGVRELGSSALQGLTARGLASFDGRTGVYRPRFDQIIGATDAGSDPAGAERRAPLPNPALRTSVAELLAAADSRATCPLCGDALPPGTTTILCARCQQEVGPSAP